MTKHQALALSTANVIARRLSLHDKALSRAGANGLTAARTLREQQYAALESDWEIAIGHSKLATPQPTAQQRGELVGLARKYGVNVQLT